MNGNCESIIKVYYADVSGLILSEKLLGFLSEARLDKLRKSNNKMACAGVELLLYYALRGKPCYSYAKNGKPQFLDSHMHFSLSHSENLVACAVSLSPVGVDIQKERPYVDAVARRVFSEEEYAFLQGCENKEKAFCSLWAKKEAVAKRTGGGIGEMLGGKSYGKACLLELQGAALAVCGEGEVQFEKVSLFELTDYFERMN